MKMAEWVTYKNHKIKACSQHLVDDRWMPLALAWLSTGDQELLKSIHGELSEIRTTENKANTIALEKAKKWVDHQH
jgi:hypothetical protein